MGAHQSNSMHTILFVLVTDEDLKAYGTIWPNKKQGSEENQFFPFLQKILSLG